MGMITGGSSHIDDVQQNCHCLVGHPANLGPSRCHIRRTRYVKCYKCTFISRLRVAPDHMTVAATRSSDDPGHFRASCPSQVQVRG